MSGQGLGTGARAALIAGFSSLLITASVLLPAEATALRHSDENALISVLLSGASVPPGRGQHTVTRQISGCFAVLDQASGPLFTIGARRALATGCETLAQRRLERAPSHAAAHQLRAEALMVQGLVPQALTAAISGETLAPNTAWLDQRRLVLLARIQPQPETGRQLFDRAVTRLARAPETRFWLAQGYTRDPALRAAIGQSAATIPASDAQRLFAMIRRLDAAMVRGE